MAEIELQVKLEAFEGPLDLLLHLIDKNKVNIYDIPIVTITDQYLAYIDEMKRQDLNIMSEFLVMAATLLSIKSKMLLPKSDEPAEEEEDPRAELVQQLLEYKMYKTIAFELKERQVGADRVFYKMPTIPDEVLKYEQPVNLDELMADVTLAKLNEIFQAVLKRQKNRVDPIRSKFGEIVQEEVSVEEKTAYMEDFLRSHKRFSFRDLLERQNSKMEVIVTFLVILEFMKAGAITIRQDHTFSDIEIESKTAA